MMLSARCRSEGVESPTYRPINGLLHNLLGAEPAIPRPLRELGCITDFRLLVTTTFDDLNVDDSKLIPAGFHALQFGHAPGGHMNDDLHAMMIETLRGLRRRHLHR